VEGRKGRNNTGYGSNERGEDKRRHEEANKHPTIAAKPKEDELEDK